MVDGPYVVQLNSDLTIPGIYEGTTPASSITWKQGNTVIATTTTAQRLDLQLNAVTKQQSTQYTCIVVIGTGDDARTVERVVDLDVLGKF